MRLVIILSGGLLLLAAACSGNSPRAATERSCTNDATIEAIRATNRTNLTPYPPSTRLADEKAAATRVPFLIADDETHCRLRRGLLTEAELTGWIQDARLTGLSDTSDEARSVSEGCGTALPSILAGLQQIFKPSTPTGDGSGALTQLIYALEPGGGERFMAGVRHSCSLRPSSASLHFETVELPTTIGEDSIGVDARLGPIAKGDESTTSHIVIFRTGDVVEVISVIRDQSDVNEIAHEASNKLARIGPIPDATPRVGEGCAPDPTPSSNSDSATAAASALLRLEDMPAGWVVDPPHQCGLLPGEGFCATDAEVKALTPKTGAGIGMRSYGASLGQSVALYSAGDASHLMDLLATRSGVSTTCPAIIDGKSFDWEFSPLSLPISGANVAWSMHTRGLPGQKEVLAFVARMRDGDAIASLIYLPKTVGTQELSSNLRDLFIGDFEKLAAQAQAKLYGAREQLSGN